MRRLEALPRRVAAPMAAGLDQRGGRLVAILCLAADIADRLVDEDGDLARLLTPRAPIDLDAVGIGDLHADGGNLAVDPHPALRDPFVGLAARTQAELRHALVQA